MEKITDAVGRERLIMKRPSAPAVWGGLSHLDRPLLQPTMVMQKKMPAKKSLQRFPFTGFTVWRCIVYLSIFKGKKPVKLVAEKSLSFLPL